jgi:hypothetical protein
MEFTKELEEYCCNCFLHSCKSCRIGKDICLRYQKANESEREIIGKEIQGIFNKRGKK